MNDKRQPEHSDGLNVGDVYFVLFRQKWIILAFCVLGFVGAAVVSVIKPAQYESEAKIYIQFVNSVNLNSTSPGDQGQRIAPEQAGYNLVQTEMEFLTSRDVADEVVSAIGADRILAAFGASDDTNAAAAVVMNNLVKDELPRTPSSLRIAFQHPDKQVARDVLRSLVEVYRKKSAEFHNVDIPEDVLTNDIDDLRAEVRGAEEKLSKAKQQAGIISTVEDTKKSLNDQFEDVSSKLRNAEVEYARAGATLSQSQGTDTNSAAATNAPAQYSNEAKIEYQAALNALSKASTDLSNAKLEFKAENLLAPYRNVFDSAKADVDAIEQKYPGIGNSPSANLPETAAQNGGVSDAMNRSQIQTAIDTLKDQLAQIRADQGLLETNEPQISELQHTWEIKSAYLKSYLESMEYANNHAHQEFSGGIKVTESPTPAVRKRSKAAKKMMLGSLAGGVLAGLFVAFMIEMVLDQSIKRPSEIEKKLRLPLFISIPDVNGQNHPKVAALPDKNRVLLSETNSTALVATGRSDDKNGTEEIGSWDPRHKLHRFYAGLRDRLIVNFEVRNLTHNPKLVGVTSCNRGAGVTSVAAGLAASLSETGDGNVLLVDMRGKDGGARQFYKGKPASGLETALGTDTRADANLHGKFYAGGDETQGGEFPAAFSKRFATLMPQLKASDYDYIVFDMPPVSQTSMTARLAGLMDMVLLVIESEKSNRDSVKRATALLKESKAHVSTVLNKVHNYVPTRLHQEFLDDEA